MKRFILAVLFIMSFTSFAQVKNSFWIEAKPNFVIKNNSQFIINPELGFYFNDLEYSGGDYTSYFRPTVDYKINDIFKTSGALGFFYSFNDDSSKKFEFRPRISISASNNYLPNTVTFGGALRFEDLIGKNFGDSSWFNTLRFRPYATMTIDLPFWEKNTPFIQLSCEGMVYCFSNALVKAPHALRPGLRLGVKNLAGINIEFEYVMQMSFMSTNTKYNSLFKLIIVKTP